MVLSENNIIGSNGKRVKKVRQIEVSECEECSFDRMWVVLEKYGNVTMVIKKDCMNCQHFEIPFESRE